MGFLSRKKKEPKPPEVKVEKTTAPKKSKTAKAVAWMFECSHPRLKGSTLRKRIDSGTPSLLCNACSTQLVFKKGKALGTDGKSDPYHKLMALDK